MQLLEYFGVTGDLRKARRAAAVWRGVAIASTILALMWASLYLYEWTVAEEFKSLISK